MEPLLDKYFAWGPYVYSLDNSIKVIDVDGKDVYLRGDNPDMSREVWLALQKELGNLKINFDEITGRLTAEQVGDELTSAESWLLAAISNTDIEVNLNITTENKIGDYYFAVGAFGGSTRMGKIITTQYFNVTHAGLYEKVGGSSVGFSALHEILESYIGGLGTEGRSRGNERIWQAIFHNATLDILPEDPQKTVTVEIRPGEKKDQLWFRGPVDVKFVYSGQNIIKRP